MQGSSCSIADANVVLNTIVSEILDRFSDRLEAADDFNGEVKAIAQETYRAHKRIVFNGNGYSEEWREEAARRGLHNYATAAEAIPHLLDAENVAVFEKHGIYTAAELQSRCDIMLDAVSNSIGVEANTMLEMTGKDILPAVIAYTSHLADGLLKKQSLGLACTAEGGLVKSLSDLADRIAAAAEALKRAAKKARANEGHAARAQAYSRDGRAAMAKLRSLVDEAEVKVGREWWPYPSYTDILFYR